MTNRLSTASIRLDRSIARSLVAALAFSGALAHAATFTVDSSGDAGDANAGDGICATAGNVCTLRAAVEEANALAAGAPHTIQFASGMVISLGSKITSTRAGTVIDATLGSPAPAPFSVEITGSAANAFELAGGTSTLRGLVIRGLQGASIQLTSPGNRVLGNRIGTNAAGTAASVPQTAWGITVDGADSQIGGTQPGEGNVISGNISWGIYVNAAGSGTAVNGTRIQGNLIGLNAAGTAALGNGFSGIVLATNVQNVLIGGNDPGARNVISGHTAANRAGIVVNTSDDDTRNVIVGNYIGTDITGTVALGNYWGVQVQASGLTGIGASGNQSNLISGNLDAGIVVGDGYLTTILGNRIGLNAAGTAALPNGAGIVVGSISRFTRIGSLSAGEGNVISGNTGPGIRMSVGLQPENSVIEGNLIGLSADGSTAIGNGGGGIVMVDQSTRAGISRNRIASTVAALAIDLGNDGVTANDALDADFDGPNGLLNFPVLTAATSGGASTQVTGTYSGVASLPLRIEFFSTPQCHASGHGDARVYLGSTDITTNGSGAASFTANLPVGVPGGHFVTATASTIGTPQAIAFVTSELSACRTVVAGSDPGGPGGPGTGGVAAVPVNAPGALGALGLLALLAGARSLRHAGRRRG